jgi:hypothetical protein
MVPVIYLAIPAQKQTFHFIGSGNLTARKDLRKVKKSKQRSNGGMKDGVNTPAWYELKQALFENGHK